LRTLLIERGRHVTHKADYQDFSAPWEIDNRGQVPEDEARRDYAIQSTSYAFNSATRSGGSRTANIHTHAGGREFHWLRGYHLGGRSLTWARQTYRFSDLDFNANKKDGTASTGRSATADLSPWYDHVERSPAFPATARDSSSCPTASS
jgi:choline dehydrogenase-like flavoprotein